MRPRAPVPSVFSYTPAPALLYPSHYHTNRTDAAITYTYSLTSFVVVRKLSVASSSTTPSTSLTPLPPSAAT
jgi:hypothetical protein